jgi:hypothetical protein
VVDICLTPPMMMISFPGGMVHCHFVKIPKLHNAKFLTFFMNILTGSSLAAKNLGEFLTF